MLKNVVRASLRGLLRLMYRVEVRGDVSPLNQGNTLIVANHESLLDGLLLGLFLPVNATFVAHTGVAKNFLFRQVLKLTPHLLVDPANPMAMKKVVQRLDAGEQVVIFPEGRISVTGSLMKTYPGTAFVAARSGANVVPVHISGAQQTPFGYLKRLYPVRWFPKITVSVHAPTKIPREPGAAKESRRKAGEALHRVLQEMTILSAPQQTLFHAFLAARHRFGKDYRLIEDINGIEASYNDILRTAVGAGRLASKITQRGDAVGVLLPNANGAVGAILGLSAMGRLPAMLNYSAGVSGIEAACHAAKITKILTSRAFIAKGNLQHLVDGLKDTHEIVYVEDLKAKITAWDKAWILAHSLLPKLLKQDSPQSAAVILFTSGSEGKPKGVVHSHQSLLTNVAQVRAVSDFTPQDKFFVALPLFHSFGLTCGTLLPLFAGCKVFLYPNPLHYRIIPELVYDRQATVLFGTPTFLAAYGRMAHPYDFARLRYVVAGAEKLPDSVRDFWVDKFGVRILSGYGVTECSPVISVNNPMGARNGTVGKLLPCMAMHLEPVPGIECGGALHVKGHNLMMGYLRYENPGVLEQPKAGDKPGWYDTGDVVSVDADGFLRIEGRIKRFAKLGGEMVSLDVAESVAIKASPAEQHAVLSQSDAAKGESLVLLTTDAQLTREMLQQTARQLGVPELAVPRQIRVLPAIPVLGTGKTDYVSLKAQVGL